MTKAGIDVLPREWTSKNLNGKSVQRIIAADVVAGILVERGRFLVEKRRADDEADPGFVEIPGGHVDPDERRTRNRNREDETRSKESRYSDKW